MRLTGHQLARASSSTGAGVGGQQHVQVCMLVKRVGLSLVDDRPQETLYGSLHDIRLITLATPAHTTVGRRRTGTPQTDRPAAPCWLLGLMPPPAAAADVAAVVNGWLAGLWWWWHASGEPDGVGPAARQPAGERRLPRGAEAQTTRTHRALIIIVLNQHQQQQAAAARHRRLLLLGFAAAAAPARAPRYAEVRGREEGRQAALPTAVSGDAELP